ncbi:Oidioi.mRNA.OKI2018_I69.PAR.g12755.t1.cds [Oikopleura dioica]|uniref:Oidioi.mRNA.OKI2018_I69.PAR.g12755.t1.cds n=1 Tax=Oikopleura dioica TaxID=34765 RepID=A0ABN7S6D2_OIKDI|nr:Oidioi.mRNA.OKI2018_I69.PAR.g12755.t1.cds [Oikopleura dioica]
MKLTFVINWMVVSCIDWTKIKCSDPKKCEDLQYRLKTFHDSLNDLEDIYSGYENAFRPAEKNDATVKNMLRYLNRV